MRLHKFLMKHGLGSPGYIAKRLGKRYRAMKSADPSWPERKVLRLLFVERIAAQSQMGGPVPYKVLRGNVKAIDELIDKHPDLFSLVLLAIFIEHPELTGPGAPHDAFDVLRETVVECLDAEAAGWRTAGLWSHRPIACWLCNRAVDRPNPAWMYVSLNDCREAEFLCEACAPPMQVRAMSVIGYFMGR